MRLWGIVREKLKIAAQAVADTDHAGDWDERELAQALGPLCKDLDLSRPVVLAKHVRELTKFGRTSFKELDFIDAIDFDAFEVEVLDDKRMKNTMNDRYL